MNNVNKVLTRTSARQALKKRCFSLQREPKLKRFPRQPSPSAREIAALQTLFTSPNAARYEFSAAKSIADIPDTGIVPEVAFLGRSNVGKSSLINGLFGRKKLVKTSSKPGHTAALNFFSLRDQSRLHAYLVDAPGYGYRSRAPWGDLIMDYIRNRRTLKRLFVLLDPLHGIKETDVALIDMLKEGLSTSGATFQIIMTKCDRLSSEKQQSAKEAVEDHLIKAGGMYYPQVLASTSKTSSGLNEARLAIAKACYIDL